MSSLIELLKDFAGAVATAASDAPDDYPEGIGLNFQMNKEALENLWSQISPRLKRSVEEAEFIDANLKLGLDAFEKGDVDVGRKAMFDIYNLEIKKLR